MNKHLEIIPLSFANLRLVRRTLIQDNRGYVERLFSLEDVADLIPEKSVAQIIRTMTLKRGTVRGMHFQHPPHAETKFVTCLRGEVFDVAVDIRQGSPSFLQWQAEFLNAKNRKTLVIPEGFAHGFQTLSNNCEMLYFHTAPYRPEAEGGLNARDPRLDIKWPLTVTDQSDRDISLPMITVDFLGLLV